VIPTDGEDGCKKSDGGSGEGVRTKQGPAVKNTWCKECPGEEARSGEDCFRQKRGKLRVPSNKTGALGGFRSLKESST